MGEEVTPSKLYSHFSDYLGMVRWGNKSFVVQKRGQPLARLISAKKVPPGGGGNRRFPRPKYKQVTPGQFRSRMADYLAQVRLCGQSVLITYHGEVVAIVKPVKEPK